jgi:hypothetical protein
MWMNPRTAVLVALTSAAMVGCGSLDPDALDRPAETSVREAERAAALASAMAGHAMSHGTYSHTDAGRDNARTPVPPTVDPHAGHAMPPSPAPVPKENE